MDNRVHLHQSAYAARVLTAAGTPSVDPSRGDAARWPSFDTDAAVMARGGQPVATRYQSELAWLADLPGLSLRAASVMAARAAGCFAALPGMKKDSSVHPVFGSLIGQTPEPMIIAAACHALSPTRQAQATLTDQDTASIEALWPVVVPTECLLASGGDERLLLDEQTGLNRYGCAPWPRPGVVSFGSCTASSLSAPAFAAAEAARRQLVAETLRTAPSVALAQASEDIATALLDYYDVADLAEAVLAASGTDAALVVTGLLAAEHPGDTLTSVLMSPSETGSGVPDAVQGRHFAASAAAGCKVGKGQPIEGLPLGPHLITLPLRQPCGAPRAPADIAAECTAAVHAGLAHGRVVLHAIDGSKTGLTAPDRDTCQRLAKTYAGKLDIVVDACQARVEPALVRWYLSQGFPVLVTGSKFFAAPGFCGAVLFPRARLQRIAKHGRLPAGLAPYARLEGGFGSRRCPGLILRWRAALHEMAAFATLDDGEVGRRLHRIGSSVLELLATDERLALVDAPRPETSGWSGNRSVFTFAVRSRGEWLNATGLRALYAALSTDVSAWVPFDQQRQAARLCQVGQPVELGSAGKAGLRIAISAAQVADGSDQRDSLMAVMDKLRMLLDAYTGAAWPKATPARPNA